MNRNDFLSIFERSAVLDMPLIAAIWVISLFFVNPLNGNFPLSDDWSYSLTVKHLLETGEFRPSEWFAPPSLTNALWGSLFCLPAGFSFVALRLSTLTLSLLGILAVYVLIRDLGQPRWMAALGALTMGSNPIYYALSNTFMTDIPFTAIAIFSALFFARSLKTGSNTDLTLAATLAIAATLSRQLALALPLAFGFTLIAQRGFVIRNLLRAAIPLLLCVGTFVVFSKWLAATGRMPEIYNQRGGEILHTASSPELIIHRLSHAVVSLLYSGLFLLPLSICAAPDIWRSHRMQLLALFAITIATTGLSVGINALHGHATLMPMFENVMINSGIGPLTLRDTYFLGLDNVPSLPKGFWLVVTALSFLGAGLLVGILGVSVIDSGRRILARRKVSDREEAGIFFLLSAVIYLIPVIMGVGIFDRYVVPAIPLFAGAIAGLCRRLPQFNQLQPAALRFPVLALLAAFSLFAVGGAHDYLAWNRVRWEALRDLTANDHVSPEDIDGGFEFNGLYLFDPHYRADPTKSWWWVHRDTYLIGFGNVPGYQVIKEYAYNSWIPPHAGKVVVLKANP